MISSRERRNKERIRIKYIRDRMIRMAINIAEVGKLTRLMITNYRCSKSNINKNNNNNNNKNKNNNKKNKIKEKEKAKKKRFKKNKFNNIKMRAYSINKQINKTKVQR